MLVMGVVFCCGKMGGWNFRSLRSGKWLLMSLQCWRVEDGTHKPLGRILGAHQWSRSLSNSADVLKGPVVPKGMLTVAELKELARQDKIDTVVVGITDCYGRLVGKRYMSLSHAQIPRTLIYLLPLGLVDLDSWDGIARVQFWMWQHFLERWGIVSLDALVIIGRNLAFQISCTLFVAVSSPCIELSKIMAPGFCCQLTVCFWRPSDRWASVRVSFH